MKIEQLIVQYLYNNRKVFLQGIGNFFLNTPLPEPSELEKDQKIHEGSITFEFDLKTYEDEGLVDFISKQTGKIKPLASADLDSFIALAKQFLNIGKPFTIEGIGTIQKNQQGEYYFVSGQFITPKLEDMTKQIREKRDESVSFESQPRKKHNNKPALIATILLLLILSGIGVYYLFFYIKNNTVQNSGQTVVSPVTDTVSKNIPAIFKDSLQYKTPVFVKDSGSYKVVLKEFHSRDSAENWHNKLTSYGNKTELIQKDSQIFCVAIPVNSPVTDPVGLKDSLDRHFNVKSYILIK